jgi:hypothetical protein
MLAEQGMCNLFARPSPQPTLPLFVSTISDPLTRSGESGRAAVAVAHELFIPDSDQSREVLIHRNFGVDHELRMLRRCSLIERRSTLAMYNT